MTIDEQLRTLIESAATPIELDELDPAMHHSTPPRRRMLPVLVGSMVLLGAGTGGALVASRPDEHEPSRVPETPGVEAPAAIVPPRPVPPSGDEYPLDATTAGELPSIPMSAWDRLGGGLGAPAVADGRSLLSWRTRDGEFYGYRTIQRQRGQIVEADCVSELGGVTGTNTSCVPVAARNLNEDVSSSWSDPPGAGTWMWTNVPDGTDYVQYRSDGTVLWQRPVDGLAVFPATGDRPNVVAIAYRSDGAILASTDPASMDAAWRAYQAALPNWFGGPEVPEASDEAAGTAAAEAFAACFTKAGNLPATRPTVPRRLEFALLPDGTAQSDDLWASCLAAAQTAFDRYVDRGTASASTQLATEDTVAAGVRCSGDSRRRLPDLVGLPEALAIANLAGYVSTFQTVNVLRPDLPNGRVISQTPAAGEPVGCDATNVKLTVSTDNPDDATTGTGPPTTVQARTATIPTTTPD